MLALRPCRRVFHRLFVASSFHTTSTFWASRKSVQTFKLADIGEGITECEIVKWSVKPTTIVRAFDPLCEVQSDKASVEITSPFEGVVQKLLVQEGEMAKVGAGLCLIEVAEDEDSSVVEEPADTTDPAPSQDPVEKHPPEQLQDGRRRHPMDPENIGITTGSGSEAVFATPAVRHFALRNGVDLAQLVPGSGKDGRVERRDVEVFLANSSASAQISPAQGDVVVELGRTRYGMWKAMTKSLEIPLFGYSTTLDLTSIHNLLPILNTHIPVHFRPPPSTPPPPAAVSAAALHPVPTLLSVPDTGRFTRLTYLPILLKTLSRAMLEWPLFRSSITPIEEPSDPSSPAQKPSLTVRPHADISIALSTPTGLYTPTITDTDTQSMYALAARLAHLAYLGRQTPCALSPAEMPRRGGTITLSNIGAIGKGEFASPLLVPGGGVAIVAVGRARWVWDVERSEVGERRLKVGVSWSADHRVVEGAELAAFVECWRNYVEAPERLIADSI